MIQIFHYFYDFFQKLLKDLQEFAFRGCTDVEEVKRKIGNNFGLGKEGVNRQKERQMELITQLKRQLEELEKFAYETGEGGLPSSEIIARQVFMFMEYNCTTN